MRKTKETPREFYARILQQYPNVFRSDNSILWCNYCNSALTATKTSHVKQHIGTDKHKNAVETRNRTTAPSTLRQSLMGEHLGNQPINEFYMDTCKMFLESNIPLFKSRHPSLVSYIEKHTGKVMPSESVLRQKYVPILFNETMEKLRQKVKDNYIWASIDETTDAEQRMVVNFIFGIMNADENSPEHGRCYLLNMAVVDATNASTMAAFFNDSLLLLWPNGNLNQLCNEIQYEQKFEIILQRF